MAKKDNATENNNDAEQIEECFIITPIGTFGSDVFNKAMGLIDAVIDPVLRELNMCAMPANRMSDLGSINKQLIKRVIEDRLVIANLTGLNPNVMYELAIRHGARKPVIIMAEEGTRLPFDITDQRTIFYTDNFSGVEQTKDDLRKKIKFALEDEEPDNPIYSYLESAKLFKEVKADDPMMAILEKLEKLSPERNESSGKKSLFLSSSSLQDVSDDEYEFVGTFSPKSEVLNASGQTKLEFFIKEFLKYAKINNRIRDIKSINLEGSGSFSVLCRSNSKKAVFNLQADLENDKNFSNIRLFLS
jgi:hypothetical protein